MVFGCQQRSIVPSLPKNLKPASPDWMVAIEKRIAQLQSRSRYYYNIGAKHLPELPIGTEVRIQNPDSKRWDEQGVIMEKGPHRDYYVWLWNGKTRWRNRRFLRPLVLPSEMSERGGDDAPMHDPESQCGTESRPRRSARKRKAPERLNF